MDFSSIDPQTLIATILIASIPILLAAIGELVVEKAGVLNLGVEGMMITGAVFGFIATIESGTPWLGLPAAAIGGALLGLLFGVLTQYLKSNQVATGLALTMFGLGFSAMLGQSYAGIKPPNFPSPEGWFLSDIPILGKILFSYDYYVYLALVIVAGVWWFLKYTRAGLALRAVGENHDSAHALGYGVVLTRIAAIMFGGACAGLGGAYLSLVRIPQWTEGMTAGAGWIALALVVFSSWKPGRLVIGAMLFGGVTMLQLNLQAAGVDINAAYMSMAPFIVTIVALAAISGARFRHIASAPASLGRTFHASG